MMDDDCYRLRCSVFGHTSDVRAVKPVPGGGFVSGSRDQTVRLWLPKEGSHSFREVHCMTGATQYVSCLCVLPPNTQYPLGLILAGCKDCAIYVFSPESSEPILKLSGHADNVCCLVAGNIGNFVSGSWDKTARCWLDQKCITELSGHKEAVWAVEIFEDQDSILTGSADATIRLWRLGKTEQIFKGHEQCVRGLAIISVSEFLSCSNDNTIRHWRTDGNCIRVIGGHEHYVYSISLLNDNGFFVTCSEDSTVRIWRYDVCIQVIKLPSESLWAVTCLENGDIAVGGSDKSIRIFTRQEELMAPETEVAELETELVEKNTPKPDQKLGDLNLDDLHEKDVLLNPGIRDGQTVLCREGDSACAYEWSENLKEWIKIGDIIDAHDTKKKKKTTFEGKEYDFVFTVDVKEGVYLKLPYNIGEDPWVAAQNFILKNGLSQEFLPEVADFITTNAGMSVTANTQQLSSSYSDPFTGANRYVPGSNLQKRPEERGDSNEKQKFFPLKTYLFFDSANFEGLKKKLTEFNEYVDQCQKLVPDEIQELMMLTELPTTVTDGQMASLDKVMGWPEQLIFPVLDLFRLAVRSSVVGQKVSEAGSMLITNYLLKYLIARSNPVNVMLVARAFCNFFTHDSGKCLLKDNIEKICIGAVSSLPLKDKRVEIAVASLFLNYSVALEVSRFPFHSMITDGVITLTKHITDTEAIYRLLVCIGTLIDHHPDTITALKCEVMPFVMSAACMDGESKISLCAKALLEKLD